ncbi:hypothetical protein SmJEL517_g06257 [Synchytrium microbalum]|uniref:AB hydrolase-1 domain-containing protein n=1 Tax=Synchytrium microbalum TaxID=1806994 RepID=A0A507BW65_9FUNG|nr:uncharacterized protein SmJEL517_g06257 [Synchytrium microbalum]TPX30094.1 hypothetical protein SmJEL517_g06257 [Synchytrium microbalum]
MTASYISFENAFYAVTGLATSLIGGALVLLWVYQTSLIYPAAFPEGSRTEVFTPDKFSMHDWEDLTLTTPDNLKIKAYLIRRKIELSGAYNDPSRSNKSIGVDKLSPYTILYLHANAGNMGHRLPFASLFYKSLKCNIFMLSYRGYGLSEGSPSEAGIKVDAQTALNYLKEHPTLRFSKIILFGQSIGGAVAIELASKNPDLVEGVIVENTFLSLPKLIPHVMPFIGPLGFLCHQIWPTYKSITLIPRTIPILMLSGLKDELVPPSHMHALASIARASRKGIVVDESMATVVVGDKTELPKLVVDEQGVRFVSFKEGKHNDTCIAPGYMDAIEKWWNDFVSK